MMLLLMFVMVVSACTGETLVEEVELTADEGTEEATLEETVVEIIEPIVEEAVKTEEAEEQIEEVEVVPEVLNQAVVDGLMSLTVDKNLTDAWSYVLQEMVTSNGITGERLILEYMILAEEQVWSASDPLYEAGWELHEAIYQVFEDHQIEFTQTHVIIGEDKALLLSYMPQGNQEVLKSLFDRGYGLVSAEGSYYAVVDYAMLINIAQAPYSDMTMDYLHIQQNALIKQTTIEEYLNLTAIELMNRCVSIEEFLITFEERPDLYTDMMTRQLNVCLYKLSTPSPFDASLDEDGTLSKDFETIYATILETEPTPVVTELVVEVTSWINSRENGYVATYNDSEELFKVSGEIYGKATEMVTTLYK